MYYRCWVFFNNNLHVFGMLPNAVDEFDGFQLTCADFVDGGKQRESEIKLNL